MMIFSKVYLFCILKDAQTCKNLHERTKILLISTLIFGIKNAFIANKEKELWDSIPKIESYLGE